MTKKVLSLLMVMALAVTTLVGCGSSNSASDDATTKIAMITDSGDITDMSFNQTTYEAAKAFSEANDIEFNYYKPTEDSDEARIASFNNAVADGYNVVVVPGYLFAPMIEEVAEANPNVTIIALDVSEGDFSEGYELPENVCCFTYQEEIAGYMAGYAAVSEGYTQLGFLGGVAVPAVIRYGYGFVQGCNEAAVEMGIADQVNVNYIYGGQFYGDDAIKAVMDTWYGNGTEVVFACGGGIWTSAAEAAKAVDGAKVIGVDVDQSATIDETEGTDGLCLTSAMKGLAATVDTTLQAVIDGNWSDYAGKVENLGLVSADDPSQNYVQLPTETWSMQNFTVEDYNNLVAKLYNGEIKVSNDTDNEPEVEITMTTFDNIH